MMEIGQIGDIARMGMQYERTRVELASLKIALMSMSFSSEVDAQNFASQLLQSRNDLQGDSSILRGLDVTRVQEQDNPAADDRGFIYKYSVDPTHEMSTLVAATRAYEANIRAYNANGQMTRAALEIGSK